MDVPQRSASVTSKRNVDEPTHLVKCESKFVAVIDSVRDSVKLTNFNIYKT